MGVGILGGRHEQAEHKGIKEAPGELVEVQAFLCNWDGKFKGKFMVDNIGLISKCQTTGAIK